METTPVSLLQRIRTTGDEEAWGRFLRLATPLLQLWAARLGLQKHDADDLVQEVVAVLVEKLPQFTYDPEKSFRGWMRTIATNKWRQWRRRPAASSLDARGEDEEEFAAPAADAFWEREFRERLVARALEIMQSEFQPTTWQACWQHVVSGRSATEVGAELGITPGAVYIAKSRVLRRLRDELRGWLE
jgi:RNA polymerase sigma-70 factor (ECF subfamily)